MSNLVDIQRQIEKLQVQASEIKKKEFDKTVEEIRQKMQAFGISIKDLQRVKPRAKGKQRSVQPANLSKNRRATVPAKYRGPNGETWSGRGLTPKWLSALISQGQSKESFAIDA